MHVELRQTVEYVGCLDEFDPAELDVLARREMTVSAIKVLGDPGKPAHLRA